MANPNGRPITTLALVLTVALAAEAQAGEADCSNVISPISGSTYKELIEQAKDYGATYTDLIKIVGKSRCRVYLENLIYTTYT